MTKMIIELEAENIIGILKSHFSAQGVDVSTVKFEINKVSDTMPVYSLKKAILEVKPNYIRNHRNSLASQIESVERCTNPFGDH